MGQTKRMNTKSKPKCLRPGGRLASPAVLVTQPLTRGQKWSSLSSCGASMPLHHWLPRSRGKPCAACWIVPGRRNSSMKLRAHRGLPSVSHIETAQYFLCLVTILFVSVSFPALIFWCFPAFPKDAGDVTNPSAGELLTAALFLGNAAARWHSSCPDLCFSGSLSPAAFPNKRII